MEHLKLNVENGIATLSINRPEAKNSLNEQTYLEFGAAIDKIKNDTDIRVLIITGEGDTFCAGVDLNFAATKLKAYSQTKFRVLLDSIQRTFCFEKLRKPVIAAVKGHALGNGFDIALACDFIIAAENTKFSMAYINYGLIPDIGGTYRLPRLVGPSVAKELILTGDKIDAQKALELGIVNRVVPEDKLMDETMALAKKLVRKSPIALSLSKIAIDKSLESDIESALQLESYMQGLCSLSEDSTEAATALFEKRDPVFKGN